MQVVSGGIHDYLDKLFFAKELNIQKKSFIIYGHWETGVGCKNPLQIVGRL